MIEPPKYFQPVTRKQPTACIIAIDCSASMQTVVDFGCIRAPKSAAVSMVANTLIHELVLRATRNDEVRHYYDIAVLGYNGISIEPLLGNELKLIPIEEVAAIMPEVEEVKYTYKNEQGEDISARFKYRPWVESYAVGLTPMNELLDLATNMLEEWCRQPKHANSFPPMVINITDGESTDGFDHKLFDSAMRLREVSTNDGNVLLVNILISNIKQSNAVIFPTHEEVPSDIYARMMADISSVLPSYYNRKVSSIRKLKEEIPGPFLAMAYNVVPHSLFDIIDIGTHITR